MTWNWTELPAGYAVRDVILANAAHDITINGVHIGRTDDPGFQAALDSYINSTIAAD